MVTIYLDPIETQNKGLQEALEAPPSAFSPGELRPRCYPVLWASATKNVIILLAGLFTPDRQRGKIEMEV
jgi:hypothetical protein